MNKKILCLVILSLTLLTSGQVLAQSAAGFNRLKAAGSGLSEGDSSSGSAEGSSSEAGADGKTGRLDGRPSGLNDIILLGVYEAYLPKKRATIRLSVYGEARQFLLGHRACIYKNKIRDAVNQYIYSNPPEVSNRGVVETKGMDRGIREAIKKALDTDIDYFTSLYVFSGRYSLTKIPDELNGMPVTDCDGVYEKKKELDKADKK